MVRQCRPAIGIAGDLQKVIDHHRLGGGTCDREGVVLDFAAAGGAGRRGFCDKLRVGTQPEPRVCGALRAIWDRRECQCHAAAVRAVGHSRGRSFGSVEHAILIVVNPARQRGSAARRVCDQQRYGRSGSYRPQQILLRVEKAVLVIRQCRIHIIRIRAHVLQNAAVSIDRRSEKQPGHDCVRRPTVGLCCFIVTVPRSHSKIRSVTKISHRIHRHIKRAAERGVVAGSTQVAVQASVFHRHGDRCRAALIRHRCERDAAGRVR